MFLLPASEFHDPYMPARTLIHACRSYHARPFLALPPHAVLPTVFAARIGKRAVRLD
jgi:hypothetical protein